MKFWQEFKAFSIRGNLIDLAVGIIIGAAFNNIVQSLVKDILTPIIGIFTDKASLTDWSWKFSVSGGENPQIVELKYGAFLQASLDFLIMAFVIFLLVRGIQSLRKKAEDPKDTSVPTPKDIELLTEIRDALVSKK